MKRASCSAIIFLRIRFTSPRAWQEIDGTRRVLAAGFLTSGDGVVSLDVEETERDADKLVLVAWSVTSERADAAASVSPVRLARTTAGDPATCVSPSLASTSYVPGVVGTMEPEMRPHSVSWTSIDTLLGSSS